MSFAGHLSLGYGGSYCSECRFLATLSVNFSFYNSCSFRSQCCCVVVCCQYDCYLLECQGSSSLDPFSSRCCYCTLRAAKLFFIAFSNVRSASIWRCSKSIVLFLLLACLESFRTACRRIRNWWLNHRRP